jgi:hypothetical protein
MQDCRLPDIVKFDITSNDVAVANNITSIEPTILVSNAVNAVEGIRGRFSYEVKVSPSVTTDTEVVLIPFKK